MPRPTPSYETPVWIDSRWLRWEQLEVGPFTAAALPAVDGIGDPQVSWAVTAENKTLLHLGDTMFHGYWWQIAQRYGSLDVVITPINGPVVDLPHRQPSSDQAIAMKPEEAAARRGVDTGLTNFTEAGQASSAPPRERTQRNGT